MMGRLGTAFLRPTLLSCVQPYTIQLSIPQHNESLDEIQYGHMRHKADWQLITRCKTT